MPCPMQLPEFPIIPPIYRLCRRCTGGFTGSIRVISEIRLIYITQKTAHKKTQEHPKKPALLSILYAVFLFYRCSQPFLLSTLLHIHDHIHSALMTSSFKLYSSQFSTIIFASSAPTTLAPKASTLQSLCALDIFAYRLAADCCPNTRNFIGCREMPRPVPQIKIPFSTSPPATAFPTISPYTG